MPLRPDNFLDPDSYAGRATIRRGRSLRFDPCGWQPGSCGEENEEGKDEKNARIISVLLAVMLVFGMFSVSASAATDVIYITNGGRQLYFPGSTFMMKGQITNNGIGLSGVSALIQAKLSSESSPFFTAAPETDGDGYFSTGFNIPDDASIGDEMIILINGRESKRFEIRDFEATISSEENLKLELLGFTGGSRGSVGAADDSLTISGSLKEFGLVFTRNVNYFADNNSPFDFTSLGENSRNADCFTLYEGDTEIGCSVTLLSDGGYDSVSYITLDGGSATTTGRNVLYISPDTSLKADTQYRLVVDEMLTGNNNVHLEDDLTVYFKTAKAGETPNGGGGGGGGTADPENPGGEQPEDPGAESPAGDDPSDVVNTSFVDVAANAWYADAVEYVVSEGLFNGVGDSRFEPNGEMSRAMFATVLARMSGETTSGYSHSFADVASGKWYSDGVAWGYSKGLINGFSETRFGPDDPITREQIAVLLYNYEIYKGGDVSVSGTNSYASMKDAAGVSSWAREAMNWAYENDIIQGDDQGLLKPQGIATRAQVATVLMRMGA